MHAKAFSLRRKGPKRLLLTWETGRRNICLYVDGDLVNPGGAHSAVLPDQSQVFIDFNWLGQPRIHRNQRPLPGSSDDPVSRIPVASGVAIIVGVLLMLPGLLEFMGYTSEGSDLHNVALTQPMDPIIAIYMFVGLALIGCGILMAFRVRMALWIALTLYGVDTFLAVLGILLSQGQEGWVASGFHGVCLYLMFRAFAGFDMLQAEAAEETIAALRKTARVTQALPESASPKPAPKPLFLTPVSSLSLDDPLLQQVETQLQLGNVAQAKAILANFMRDNPTNGYGWYLASFVLTERDRQLEALERSLRYNPDLKQARERLAVLKAG
jgi:hypothetical protein